MTWLMAWLVTWQVPKLCSHPKELYAVPYKAAKKDSINSLAVSPRLSPRVQMPVA